MDYEGVFNDLYNMKLRAIRERNAAQNPCWGQRNGDRWYRFEGFVQECSYFQYRLYVDGRTQKLDLNR